MTIPLDIRAGLPSASSLPRLSKCAASWRLSQLAAKQGIGNHANASSQSGHAIHAWLETHGADEWDALSDDEKETATKCYAQAEWVIAQWGAEIDGCLAEREKRLWLFADGRIASTAVLDAEPVFSGAADLIVHGDRRALVIDYKSGRSEYEAAPGNQQLLGLGVLVAGWTGARNVRVALIQPWAGPPSVADYDGSALDQAKAQLLDLLKHIEEPDLTPNPGDWCRYCPALSICPALNAEREYLAALAPTKQTIGLAVARFDGPMLGKVLDAGERAEWAYDAAKAEAKRRITEGSPNAPVGFGLSDGAKTREINNLGEAFMLLAKRFGMTAERMMAACKASLPGIETDVAKHKEITKAQAVQEIAEELGPFITYGRKSPSLIKLPN